MNLSTSAYGPHGGPVQVFYRKKELPRRPSVARGEGIYLWATEGRR